MNSNEISMGAANYIAITNRIMEIAVQRGAEAGIKAAMEYLMEEKKAQRKGRYDRRLRMLNYYRIACEESGKEEEMRCYRIIKATYIDEEKKSAEEIAEMENVERRTVYKNINMAIKPLSALFFGVDSIKIY